MSYFLTPVMKFIFMIPFAPSLCRSCRILNQGERERERERIERSLKSNPHPCHVDTLLIAKISTAIYTQTGQELEKLLNYNRQDHN